MTHAAPELSKGDIQIELDRIFSRERRAFLAALYGRGEPGHLTAAGRDWVVVPTACEMELRARMPLSDSHTEQGRVFLVDWTDRPLPLDLSCRLAAAQIFQISRSTRLAGLFGARQAEPGLMESGLSRVLLSGEITGLKKVSGIRLTQADAMRRFLQAWANFPLGDKLTMAQLVPWCLRSNAGEALVQKAVESDAWQKLRAELRDFVWHEAGPAAELLWRAWEHNLASRFVQVAVLVEAHVRKGDAVAEGLLQGRLPELAPGFGTDLLELSRETDLTRWIDLPTLLEETFEHLDDALSLQLLQEADALIPQESFAPTRAASSYLPSGYEASECVLAASVDRLADEPSFETFIQLESALDEIKQHHLDTVIRTEDQRETRLMAARLAGYLVKRRQEPTPAAGYAYQPAIDLAQAYAAEGGFVDWCRGRLRAPLPFHTDLNAAIHRVLKAADELRRADDQRFSTAVVSWVEAGQPSNEVSAVDAVTRQFVGELLAKDSDQRVLIILMDGMSWAAAVQLLSRLETEQWAPILWRPKGYEARTHFPPVLASLPTLTNVSRAAFFAGRRDSKAGDKHTHEDAKRWATNKALIRANADAALPELILRNQLMDGESLQRDVRETIEGEHAVVGVVVNAIDEELKGSSQVMRDYSRTVIKPLAGLLNVASGTERVVLLASDHGHVLGDAMKPHGLPLPGKQVGGKRWRALGPDDVVHPFELELPRSAWRPGGTDRIAAIWDETVVHGHPDYGEHGGLSLSEVVAPAILIAPEWLARLRGDDGAGLETRPFLQPTWWELDVRPPRGERRLEPAPEVGQMTLLPDSARPPKPLSSLPPAQVMAPLVEALRKSKIFKVQIEVHSTSDVEKVLVWLSIIADAGDALSDRDFARRCQTRPHRVAGLVARMGMLNCDGYAMVEHNRSAQQVVLNRSRLLQQYGLEV